MPASRKPVRAPFVFLTRSSGPGEDEPPSVLPPLDVVDDGKVFRLVYEIPGADASRLSVEVSGRVVTVRGERRITEAKGGRFLRVERIAGPFERSLELPEDPEPEGAEASYSDGLLTLLVPRRSPPKKHIPIRSTKSAPKAK
ncbi:MAG: Hsp20/alpha crystallin family protein [Acidobacteria bacterium]|nr:Hsp20/alpha crystallin family protein [Acidobacteriota bacterium]